MSDDIKRKIKALLTKAEGTEFQKESDAFYAKAAELMAKHSIAEAELHHEDKSEWVIERRRYVVMAPYSMDRLQLIVVVARALGGDAYYIKQKRDGYKTATKSKDHNTYAVLIGFPEDLDNIEMMLESLNRQMEHSRERQQRNRYFGGMGEKKIWNATFIRAYAYKIAVRLKESYDEIMNQQTGSVALALRDKKQILKDELEKLTSGTTKQNRKHSWDGWAAGETAANQATIRREIR